MGMYARLHSSDEKFCACKFVSDLIEEGSQIRCDETSDDFYKGDTPPAFYDSDKFKRGQKFFHKHIYAMLFSKIMGLVTLLSIPEVSHILKFTQMSDDPQKAYKRYLSTVLHMYIWYKDDFHPGSKTWKSIDTVKSKHNSASRKSYEASKVFISQKSMALTQFGFMGYAIWQTKLVGIYGATKEELEGFIHIWRVIGYTMGMDDRFNICRESVKETQEICTEMVHRLFKPEVQKMHEDFLTLSYSLLTGMWCMMPCLDYKAVIYLAATIVNSSSSSTNNNNLKIPVTEFPIRPGQKVYAKMMLYYLSLLRFTVFRIVHQYIMYLAIWFMKHCPFLAYYMFGKANSRVRVLD